MLRKYIFYVATFCSALVLVVLAFALASSRAFAASLYFAPASRTISVGTNFTVSVDVSSEDQAMNAASGDVSFPSDKLRVLSVSNAGSAMNLWVQNPSFSNAVSGGDINFAGVVLNPGFTGAAGNVITIRFQAVAVGNAALSFSAGAVFANDGNGTNILSSMGSASFTITPAVPELPSTGGGPTPAVTPSPPAPFAINAETTDQTDPQPMVSWSTTAPSGIAKYLVKIGDGDWFDASTIEVSSTPNMYQLPLQAPGKNIPLAVDAYDHAGDVTEATTTFSIAALPTPLIRNYSKTIAAGQVFTIEGTIASGNMPAAGAPGAPGATNAAENMTVKIYLEQGGNTLTFVAPVDANGDWSTSQNVTAAGGTWSLKAQATDARGAVSAFTPTYTVTVGGWLNEAIAFLLAWGSLILLALLLLAAIIAFAYYIVNRLRRFHVLLSRDLVRERKELRDDLRRIEKELEAERLTAKKRDFVKKEIDHLEEDLKRDIKENE